MKATNGTNQTSVISVHSSSEIRRSNAPTPSSASTGSDASKAQGSATPSWLQSGMGYKYARNTLAYSRSVIQHEHGLPVPAPENSLADIAAAGIHHLRPSRVEPSEVQEIQHPPAGAGPGMDLATAGRSPSPTVSQRTQMYDHSIPLWQCVGAEQPAYVRKQQLGIVDDDDDPATSGNTESTTLMESNSAGVRTAVAEGAQICDGSVPLWRRVAVDDDDRDPDNGYYFYKRAPRNLHKSFYVRAESANEGPRGAN